MSICATCGRVLGRGWGCLLCGEEKRKEAHEVKQIPLKPCPFCGKQLKYMTNGGWNSATIKCECGIRINSTLKPGFPTDRELVDFWNTRVQKGRIELCDECQQYNDLIYKNCLRRRYGTSKCRCFALLKEKQVQDLNRGTNE